MTSARTAGQTMPYVLAGFRQLRDTRRYYFDAIDEGAGRKRVSVSANVVLIRKYGISLQELPLLCRRLLEKQSNVTSIDFTESEMALFADKRAAEASAAMVHRRPRKRVFPNIVGQAWRGGKSDG